MEWSRLRFLSQLPELGTLEITDWNATDVGALHDLPRLCRLKVFTYCKTAIDFSRLPDLEECSLEWRPNASSIFQHARIKKLFINRYRGKNATAFEKMNLESLSLANPTLETLEGFGPSTALTFLGVYRARRLRTLRGIEALSTLVRLEINDCPAFQEISPLAALRDLEELQLCNDGEIQSLKPLIDLRSLRLVLFYESTNIVDGDLSPLEQLPRLEHVVFVDRPHYTHRADDLPRRVPGSA